MVTVKKITAHDVMLAADASISTVSSVLNGKGRTPIATEERVNAATEELGSVRNHQVSALHDGQSGVIGLIVCDLSVSSCVELTAGLTEALEAQGRIVFLFHDGKDDGQLAQRLSLLPNQGVDGAIIAGVAGSSDDLRWIAKERATPVIPVSHASYLGDVDTVRLDNTQAAQLLTEHLIHNGHQRIAQLGGQSSSSILAGRMGGYCVTLLKFDLLLHNDWVLECTSSQKRVVEATATLLRYNPTTSTAVCHNETVAMGAWSDLLRAGRQSGESGVDRYFEQWVSLAVLTDTMPTTLDDTSVTWASTSARELGTTLADCMMQKVIHEETHSCNLAIPTRFITEK